MCDSGQVHVTLWSRNMVLDSEMRDPDGVQ